MNPADWERTEHLRHKEHYDWKTVIAFRNKEDCGHEQPWLRFLAGENSTYPETILSESYGQVCRRLELIRQDQEDLTQVNIHHWQELNPVLTEALIQLTLGAPQVIYNGGLLLSRVRYFDLERQRPGLPQDVAALVERLEDKRTVLKLINSSPFQVRDVVIQAGAFGEHQFLEARYAVRTSAYPGSSQEYAAPELQWESRSVPIQDKYLHVHMPPATEIELDLEMARFINRPSYAQCPPASAISHSSKETK